VSRAFCSHSRPLLAIHLLFDDNFLCDLWYLRHTLQSPDPFYRRLDAGFEQRSSDGRWSTFSSARQLVDTLLGDHGQRRLLSDIKVGIAPDEYDLFSRASFDRVRCSHDPD
jgi:hypothetical protein